jgi:lipid-binding SYLF domain-containing protein
MVRISSATGALVFFVLALLLPGPASAEKGIAKIDESIAVLEQLVSIPEKGIPPALLSNAGGIAIIPGVIKAGFILGGRYGTGVLLLHEKGGGWSNPVFISLTGGSVGWQIGVESIDIILVFKSKRSIESILKGKFTLGADASVAAGSHRCAVEVRDLFLLTQQGPLRGTGARRRFHAGR